MLAFYKYIWFLDEVQGAEFDKTYPPNTTTPNSGIYRCEGCGKSATFVAGKNMPPQNHHQHTAAEGAILWRPVVLSHWA